MRQVAILPIEIICPNEIIWSTFPEFLVTISFIIFVFISESNNGQELASDFQVNFAKQNLMRYTEVNHQNLFVQQDSTTLLLKHALHRE